MSLNKSIVEAAALEWFGELGYAVGYGPHLAPGEPAAERESFGEVVLVGRLRAAMSDPSPFLPSILPNILPFWQDIRRLNPTIPAEARAVAGKFRTTQLPIRGEGTP